MSQVDGLIEPDPFDPAVAALAEKEAGEIAAEERDAVEAFVRRRMQAYRSVFVAGNADPGDVLFVMADLAWFCRAYSSTFSESHARASLMDGRREVFLRITDHTLLDHDVLVVKYNSDPRARGN